MDVSVLEQAVIAGLKTVIDPETGLDVVEMGLIEDLAISADGFVSYKFRPSSPFCPLAIPLTQEIKQAVANVDGVTGQDFEIVGFALGEDFQEWLRQAMDDETPG